MAHKIDCDAIVRFWRKSRRRPHQHVSDQKYLTSDHHHDFRLKCLARPWSGPICKAPVILVYANPGYSRSDEKFSNKKRRPLLLSEWSGKRPHFTESEYPGWTKWFRPRVKQLGKFEDLSPLIAVLNLIPYHSPKVQYDWVNVLPSANIARRFLKETLIPQAWAGKKFVVVMRARKHWGVSKADECGNFLISDQNRGGQVPKSVARKIRKWLELKKYLGKHPE
jgi:hypothetical protein